MTKLGSNTTHTINNILYSYGTSDNTYLRFLLYFTSADMICPLGGKRMALRSSAASLVGPSSSCEAEDTTRGEDRYGTGDEVPTGGYLLQIQYKVLRQAIG